MSAGVLCTGLALLDHVFRTRAPPEWGAKTFAEGYDERLGGIAANAARAVSALGGRAIMLGRVGDDGAGARVRALLEHAGVDCTRLETAPGATPVSAVVVDATGERMIINRKDEALFTAPPAVDLGGIGAVMADLRWPAALRAVLPAATARGLPVVLDCDQAPEDAGEVLGLASHVILAERALSALTGEAGAEAGLRALRRRCPAQHLAVTRGARGVSYLEGDTAHHIAALPVTARDTLGAGDVFHGAAALALAEGAGFAPALHFATAAAARAVSDGIDALNRAAVNHILGRHP